MPSSPAPSYVSPPFASYPVALQFSPTRGSKVTVPDWSVLGLTGPRITAQAWIRPEDVQSEHTIVCVGDQQRGFFLRIADGNYEIGVYRDGQTIKASAPVPEGDLKRWIHVCGSYDGSAWHIHRNGDHLVDVTTPLGLPDAIHGALAIGGTPSSTAFFAGQIRNVCVWNEPRTAEQELRDLFAVDSKAANVALYLPMFEGEGDICIDFSRGANDATIVNATWAVPVDATPNAMYFPGAKNGAAPFVTIPGAALAQKIAPAKPSTIAVSAWVKNAGENADPAVERMIFGNDTFVLRIMNGCYELGMVGDASNWVSGTIPAGDADEWVHLSGVYDSARQEWRLMRNGFLLIRKSSVTGFVAPPDNTNWYLGGSPRAHASPAAVEIRMVWLHTFPVRTPSIRTVYMPRSNQDGLPDHQTLRADGVIAYWPLDEGSGERIRDMRWLDEVGILKADADFDATQLGWSFAPPLPAMVFVNADTTPIADAIGAIRDNSAAKPYRIYLGPGSFSEGLRLPPFVSLFGAGEQQTTLSYSAQRNAGIINLSGDGSEVRQLAVTCNYAGQFGSDLVSIQVEGPVKVRVDHVTAKVVGDRDAQGMNVKGFYVQGEGRAETNVQLSNCTLITENVIQGSALLCMACTVTMLNCHVSGGYWGTLAVYTVGLCKIQGGSIRAPKSAFDAITVESGSQALAYKCAISGMTEGAVTIDP